MYVRIISWFLLILFAVGKVNQNIGYISVSWIMMNTSHSKKLFNAIIWKTLKITFLIKVDKRLIKKQVTEELVYEVKNEKESFVFNRKKIIQSYF